ncbi:MAG: TQO small subunit DoxD [Nakamurella sp.]
MSAPVRPRTPASSAPTSRVAHDRAAEVSAFVVRIVVGLLWLDNISWKVPPSFGADDGTGLYYFTKLAVDHPVLQPYSSLVENFILPNFAFFGWAVYLLEICLMVFLLAGLATRFWAVVGIVQTIAIFLSVGASPNEWKWSYFLMAAAHLAVLGFAAGRVWGLDAWLRRKVPDSRRPWARAYLLAS